jgi:hypothetical protein
MALDRKSCLVFTDDCALFIVRNTTGNYDVNNTGGYGAPNEARADAAEVLIVAHVTEAEVEEFITIDSTPYLSKLEYSVSNTIDGHYRWEFLRFPLYSGVTSYVIEIVDGNDIIITYANLIYYSATNKFYKKIGSNGSGVAPDAINGVDHWEEITDFTLSSIRNNSTISVVESNDLYDCRGRKCTKDELYKLGCGCTDDVSKLLPYLKKKVYLASARSRNADLNPEQAETITRTLQKLCPTCNPS